MNLAACLLEVVEEVKNMGQENKSFPSNALEALALLYVESKDRSGARPEDLLTWYNQAYYKLREIDAEGKEKLKDFF